MECAETVEVRVAKSIHNKASEKVEKFLFKSLGPGDRAFEPHYSDQNPSEITDFRGVFHELNKKPKFQKMIERIVPLFLQESALLFEIRHIRFL